DFVEHAISAQVATPTQPDSDAGNPWLRGESLCGSRKFIVSISIQGGSMTASTGTGSVLVCALDEIEWQRLGRHRGPGLTMKSLAFRGDGRGSNLHIAGRCGCRRALHAAAVPDQRRLVSDQSGVDSHLRQGNRVDDVHAERTR